VAPVSAVTEAMAAYRAAVDEVRRAEYVKQRAAQALYEARKEAGSGEDATVGYADGDPLPSSAFPAAIAYIGEPTKDGRTIKEGAIDWQFGKRVPVTAGFEGGTVIGHAIPSHIDVRDGSVMATVYIDDADALRRIGEPIGSISLGFGLDSIEAEVSNAEPPFMTLTAGRLRQVAAQSAESAAWPGVVVKR
jgi:hypothetical protein